MTYAGVPGTAMRRARRAARLRLAAAAIATVAAIAWASRRGGEPDPWVPTPVDLNAAGTAELTILPGVGPSLAAAIVADRDANGAFRSVEDLDRVRGIGPGLLARIRPHAVAGDAPAADPAYAAR
jgi:competence protein ComEA